MQDPVRRFPLPGLFRLEQYPSPGRKAKEDLASGFSPVKTALGQEHMDTRPDTAFASFRMQPVHDIADVTALAVGYCLENIALDFCWHKNFRGFILDFLHGFHIGVLVIVIKNRRLYTGILWCPGDSPV